ncbi:MAG: VOC family protein [Candidatus Micrarchaeota archaeon]
MGNIAYFEIPADDLERAKKFYQKVFGWDIQKYLMTGVPEDYHSVMTGKPQNVKGPNYEMSQLNSGGMMKRMFPNQPIMNYVQVDSVEKTMEMIKKNGGKEMGERMDIPNVGKIAFFKDSEGNVLALWQPMRKM